MRRDVVVESNAEGTLAVISDAPAIPEEILTLDLIGERASASLTVQVIESRPVVVDGTVRHSLRLSVLDLARQTA